MIVFMSNYLKTHSKILWVVIFSVFFMLMLRITLKYIPFNSNIAFLNIKQTEVQSVSLYLTVFYIHVYSSIFTLFAGFTQFNETILKNNKRLHKAIGKLYFYTVIFLSAPSGLFIGIYANGGFYSKISFVLLAILWFWFTIQGILKIKKNNYSQHKYFMMRSFALAFSAITLRFWKVIIVYLFESAPMDVYQIIAWLGWIPNLLIVEYYIFKAKR